MIQIIEPNGILDGTKASEFRQQIHEVIRSGTKVILIDFTHVTFMDSSGLGTLVMSLKTIEANGAKLSLCSINDQVKMLFELTGMDSFFEIFSNRKEFEETMNKFNNSEFRIQDSGFNH